MPRYFFDVFDDGRVMCDANGDVLADRHEVRDMVVALLSEMASEKNGGRDRYELTISTRNEQSVPVYKASLAFDGIWGVGR